MSISSFPTEAFTDLRVSMECATNECVATLELIAEYAADAPVLVKQIETVASLMKRFEHTRYAFRPGRISSLVESKYEAMSVIMSDLVQHVRDQEFAAAELHIDKIHQLAKSVSLLLQVEAN